MYRQAIRLFQLYRNHHKVVRLTPTPLVSNELGRVGYIDRAEIKRGKIHVDGWAFGTAASFAMPGQSAVPITHQKRHDINGLPGPETPFGFRGEADYYPELYVEIEGKRVNLKRAIPSPTRLENAKAESIVAIRFVRDLLRTSTQITRYRRDGSPTAKSAIKHGMRLTNDVPRQSLDKAFFGDIPDDKTSSPFTIIMPVFNAADLLVETLRRISRHTCGDWHLIAVDDASSDPRVTNILREFKTDHAARVTVVRKPENSGYIGSVNLALSMVSGPDPVVLLNTDAWVPMGWDSRLLAPLTDRRIASVTPMSNNAEILTVPEIGFPVDLGAGQIDKIDQIAKGLSNVDAIEVPTGVGFCMAISGDWLAKIGRLDPTFGAGYGEEVDWCQRARLKGGRHVVQPRLFVEHAGSASFGSDVRDLKVRESSQIIASRYKDFDLDVQRFVISDPLATPRFALALAWAAEHVDGEVPIFLAHSLGGGAEIVLNNEVMTVSNRLGAAIVLRVGGADRWRLELHRDGKCWAESTDDFEIVKRLLNPFSRRHIYYSCAVGDPDPTEIPGFLLDLAKENKISVRIHDYFVVSPSIFLTDGGTRFVGAPTANSTEGIHTFSTLHGDPVPLAAWQVAWGELLSAASEIQTFSNSSAELISSVYPLAKPAIVVRPHKLTKIPGKVNAMPGFRPTNIGILGNLSPAKGAGVVCRLGKLMQPFDPDLVLLGGIDPSFSVPSKLKQHGRYEVEEIADLAFKYRIGAWLIPSICPETFSFATHEALASGLPVVGFDLGAQAEALTSHPNGTVVPLLRCGRPNILALRTALLAKLDHCMVAAKAA